MYAFLCSMHACVCMIVLQCLNMHIMHLCNLVYVCIYVVWCDVMWCDACIVLYCIVLYCIVSFGFVLRCVTIYVRMMHARVHACMCVMWSGACKPCNATWCNVCMHARMSCMCVCLYANYGWMCAWTCLCECNARIHACGYSSMHLMHVRMIRVHVGNVSMYACVRACVYVCISVCIACRACMHCSVMWCDVWWRDAM